MTPQTLSYAGGIFVWLALAHFLIDWVFQSHEEAMKKSSSALWRARHCFIYAGWFMPVLMLLGLQGWSLWAGWAILFVSHFIEDTYYPVFLWAKHIRRIPALRDVGLYSRTSGLSDRKTMEQRAFKELFSTPLGLVLFITIDQIIHLLCLLPIVYLAMH